MPEKKNLQKHMTGSLLVDYPPSSPKESSPKEESTSPEPKVSLRKRVTERLLAPAPDIEEPDREILDI